MEDCKDPVIPNKKERQDAFFHFVVENKLTPQEAFDFASMFSKVKDELKVLKWPKL